MTEPASAPRGRVLVAHPSPDLYGSDLQLVSAIGGLVSQGWRATVVIPEDGPLVERLERLPDVAVWVRRFPVLRRAAMRPPGLLTMLFGTPFVLLRLVRLVRSVRPDVVYVNTVTIPWWVVAARLARVPVVVHVREAEEAWPRLVRWLLAVPLVLASSVVTNSVASRRVLLESVPRLGRRTSVIYNGIAGPAVVEALPAAGGSGAVRLALVARLSPRKGVDVALDAVGLLRAQGRDVVLDVCGTAYAGYEWFEAQLRERAGQADLAGAVRFLGYVNPTWPLLGSASVVLVPSRVEPFGNTAVEGLLAGRPVVASRVQGLSEIVTDGRTGLLVEPGDAQALAAAVGRLLDDAEFAAQLAANGRAEAEERFSVNRYQNDVDRALSDVRSARRPGGDMGARVLVAHPSPDLYGSDRQLLEVTTGLLASDHDVRVYIPSPGPLVPLLADTGADVETFPFRVLRRAVLSPLALLWLAASVPMSVLRLWRLVRSVRPDVVYVNTVTIPWWVVAARLARVPVVVHVHEAEEAWPRLVRWLLAVPLVLASSVVTNSVASRRVLLESVPRLGRRTSVIYNGIAGPAVVEALPAAGGSGAVRLALVARLSPRKGVDVALDAVGLLRAQGRDVVLDVCGTAYAGYEWFEAQLRERAGQADLAGAVRFLGYVNPTWPLLGSASVVLVPSRVEPFGNTAVEGLLAGRPVVASRVQGLSEIVTDGRTGLLVEPGDAQALAAAVGRLLDDPAFADSLAEAGRTEAEERFSVERYQRDIVKCIDEVIGSLTLSRRSGR